MLDLGGYVLKKIIIIFLFILVGCSNEKVVEPDTPFNAAHLIKFQIDHQEYDRFQSLFAEGKEDSVSLEEFKEFGEISTSGANFKNYELVTFSNGEMLLVEFKPKLDEEEHYEIVSVIKVPEEMKELFSKE